MEMNKPKSTVDTIILALLGLEYIGFGLLGLIDPLRVANLVGFGLNELISFSEIRANYSFFTLIGILAFVAIFKNEIQRLTYLIYAFLCGSYVVGRILSIILDGVPDRTLWIVIVVALTVFLLAFWRLKIIDSKPQLN